jgi:hypothetical protein
MPTNEEAAHAASEINLNIPLSPLKKRLMRRLPHSHLFYEPGGVYRGRNEIDRVAGWSP